MHSKDRSPQLYDDASLGCPSVTIVTEGREQDERHPFDETFAKFAEGRADSQNWGRLNCSFPCEFLQPGQVEDVHPAAPQFDDAFLSQRREVTGDAFA